MSLTAYVEGPTDVQLALKVAQHAGLSLDRASVFAVGGYGAIDTNLKNFRELASVDRPIWVLRDCDPTAPNHKGQRFARCAGVVVKGLGVSNAAPGWAFRLARHEAESWLMADSRGFSKWLGIDQSRVPKDPDEILKAKLEIVKLARHSQKPQLIGALIPRAGSTAEFGPAFEAALQSFVSGSWSPSRAA